ncbi:oligosaccharide flippase family protein [Micromonospora sp. DR5-3]|uniref:lipopolysaccharide biosynthesis protein n=1 Tax=unclassified Micromonospora TaxID=2617518 RepID=UPI0016526C49|nr:MULTISPECIES: oligosaccharide flippase family protein [unclassified Micromonospora]MCW3814986.1 oligosaccharide flippase family protein [Micromonospora sp. DR5-3]
MPAPTTGAVLVRRPDGSLRSRLAGLLPSSFYRQVSALTLATAASQVVSLIATVLLARLYAPVDFGQYSIALAAATILATVATLRLEMAVPLAEDDQEAGMVAFAAVLLSALAAAGLLAVLIVAMLLTGRPWFDLGAGTSVWLVPPAVAAVGALAAFRMLLSRQQRFGAISRSRFTASLVQNAAQLGAGRLGLGGVGLSLGFVCAQVWNTVSMWRGSGLGMLRLSTCGAAVVKWRRFSLMLLWPSLLNTVTVSAVAPLVALCYGVTVSGLFAFAIRIVALPATLVGQAVATVFYPKMAEQERAGVDQEPAIQRAITGLTMLGTPFFGLVMLLGPDLYAMFFGEQWRAAGLISAVLAPWLAVSFVSSPLSSLMTVKKQLTRLLLLSVVEAALRLGALAAGVLRDRPMMGIAAYSVSGVLICLYYVRWSLRIAGSRLRSWAWGNRRYLLVVGVGYPALLLLREPLPRPLHAALAGSLTVALVGWAAGWLYRQGRRPGGAPPREASPGHIAPAGVGAAE